MSDEIIEVVVGHLCAPVSKAAYEANPLKVEAEVLANRLLLRLDGNDTVEQAQALIDAGEF